VDRKRTIQATDVNACNVLRRNAAVVMINDVVIMESFVTYKAMSIPDVFVAFALYDQEDRGIDNGCCI
jgi:hypothetical protein